MLFQIPTKLNAKRFLSLRFKQTKKLTTGLLFGLLALFASSQMALGQSSVGSTHLSQGLSLVGVGSLAVLAGSSEVVVESVKTVGASTIITLQSLQPLASGTVQVASATVGVSALATGEVIKLVTTTTGTLLIRSGEILAHIPNQVGNAMLYQAKRP